MNRRGFLNFALLCLLYPHLKGENMKQVKDIFGNTILLDENDEVILKNYRFNPESIFDSTPQTISITNEEFLKEDKKRATKLYHYMQECMKNSPFASYTPSYLNPNDFRDRSYFLEWRDLYLKEPKKGSIAPWSKEEKEYYLSLKTREERYAYLIFRSGLKSAVIDIPNEVIANPKKYPEIVEKVYANAGTMRSDLHMQEWGIALALVGNPRELGASALQGFTARYVNCSILALQLDTRMFGDSLNRMLGLSDAILFGLVGRVENPLKASIIRQLAKTLKPDEFGMLPFINEIIGEDWIMDFSSYDIYGDVISQIQDELDSGKILDPRNPRATKETQKEYKERVKFLSQRRAEASALDLAFDPNWGRDYNLEIEIQELYARVRSLTPPQGYIYAPPYYFQEELDELFEAGKLDRKLDPRIPAFRRVGFPHDLVKRIEEFKERKQ